MRACPPYCRDNHNREFCGRTIYSTQRAVSHGKSLAQVAAFHTMKRTRTMKLGRAKRRWSRKRKDKRSEGALGPKLGPTDS